ncbi:MAG: sulfite exporter TauE/SafE family protein [Solirubrobacteraceae bacterium]
MLGGGSALAVPVLVYVLGQTVHQATTASLVVVTPGAVIGSLSHARDGRVCWRHAAGFIAAALPGVIVGTALGQAVSGRALIAALAVIMPTLAVALAFSMRMAVGTSLVIITVTSLMALSAHLAAGRTLDVGVTVAMTVSAIAGGAGRRASRRRRSAASAQPGLRGPRCRRRRVPTHLSGRPWRSPRHILTARSPLRYERLRHTSKPDRRVERAPAPPISTT